MEMTTMEITLCVPADHDAEQFRATVLQVMTALTAMLLRRAGHTPEDIAEVIATLRDANAEL